MLQEKMIFVYDIDDKSEKTLKISRGIKEFFKGDTCPLHKIIFKNNKIEEEWEEFLRNNDIYAENLAKKDFLKNYENYNIYDKNSSMIDINDISYPAVFSLIEQNTLQQIITKVTVNKCKNVECFKKIVKRKKEEIKEIKETKKIKDTKEIKDPKEIKDTKETKDKDAKNIKNTNKEIKEIEDTNKEIKEIEDANKEIKEIEDSNKEIKEIKKIEDANKEIKKEEIKKEDTKKENKENIKNRDRDKDKKDAPDWKKRKEIKQKIESRIIQNN
ncbi:MAG: hypothetical protein GX362_03005 [Methanosarcinaceae archaeon]|nr:hypothetical protein [Methanosarcinaceae archaeon]